MCTLQSIIVYVQPREAAKDLSGLMVNFLLTLICKSLKFMTPRCLHTEIIISSGGLYTSKQALSQSFIDSR